jgi:hypothetical protein
MALIKAQKITKNSRRLPYRLEKRRYLAYSRNHLCFIAAVLRGRLVIAIAV